MENGFTQARSGSKVNSISAARSPKTRDIPIQDGSSGDGDAGEVGRFKHLAVKGRGPGEHRAKLSAGVTAVELVDLVGELGRRKGFGERDMANGWIQVDRGTQLRTFIAGGTCLLPFSTMKSLS